MNYTLTEHARRCWWNGKYRSNGWSALYTNRFSASHREAVRAGIAALCSGCPILVDVKLIAAGLNEERLASYGCTIRSFISDEDVIATAKSANTTRAIEAMRKAERLGILDGPSSPSVREAARGEAGNLSSR